ncbi:MAG: 50S ribosomal protein L21 [Lachnospiraceae bacterium]|nr:50S ribosomal protein L21 [Lachnospiraceae bacterium]
MYAIIETGGKQYKVESGKKYRFEKLDNKVGDKVTFDKVLVVSDSSMTVGNPYISGKTVSGEVTMQSRDSKVVVYRYKRKSGYHKKNGHRQPFTEVKIDSIG